MTHRTFNIFVSIKQVSTDLKEFKSYILHFETVLSKYKRKIIRKSLNIWKQNNTLLNKPWVKENIKRQTRNNELNENEHKTKEVVTIKDFSVKVTVYYENENERHRLWKKNCKSKKFTVS